MKIATLSSKKLGDSYEGTLKNNYLYQGAYSELDDDIGWNDFALRNYDAQIGRWVQQDPYQEFASSYVGMGNDPINLTDPSGGSILDGLSGIERVVASTIGGAAIGTAISLISGDDDFTGTLIGAGAGLTVGLGSLIQQITASMGIQTAKFATNVINTSEKTEQVGRQVNSSKNRGGIQITYKDDNGKTQTANYDPDKRTAKDKNGNKVSGRSIDYFINSLNNRLGDDENIIEKVSRSKKTVRIIEVDENYAESGTFKARRRSIYIDPDATHTVYEVKTEKFFDGSEQDVFHPIGELSPATILLHELAHALHWITDKKAYKKRKKNTGGYYDNEEERKVIQEVEWPAVKKRKEPVRNNHR